MHKLIPTFVFLFTVSCTTHPFSEGREQYVQKIDRHSAGDKQFAGLYNNFEFRATLLNRDVSSAIHERLRQYYDWSEQDAAEKLKERMGELDVKTEIWLSFFTPDSSDDNLSHKDSIWKIYLVADGKRYEGKARKAKQNLSEAKSIIPYHTRWATAYYVDFPVSTDQVEGRNIELVITGPLGRREVQFAR